MLNVAVCPSRLPFFPGAQGKHLPPTGPHQQHQQESCLPHATCGVGYHVAPGSSNATAAGSCTPCQPGTYQPHDHHLGTVCLEQPRCGPGQRLTSAGPAQLGACTVCAAGTYQTETTHRERVCAQQITACTAGQRIVTGTASRACHSRVVGVLCMLVACWTRLRCEHHRRLFACTTHARRTLTSTRRTCQRLALFDVDHAHTGTASSAARCVPCPPGTYQDDASHNETSCAATPANTSTAATAAARPVNLTTTGTRRTPDESSGLASVDATAQDGAGASTNVTRTSTASMVPVNAHPSAVTSSTFGAASTAGSAMTVAAAGTTVGGHGARGASADSTRSAGTAGKDDTILIIAVVGAAIAVFGGVACGCLAWRGIPTYAILCTRTPAQGSTFARTGWPSHSRLTRSRPRQSATFHTLLHLRKGKHSMQLPVPLPPTPLPRCLGAHHHVATRFVPNPQVSIELLCGRGRQRQQQTDDRRQRLVRR